MHKLIPFLLFTFVIQTFCYSQERLNIQGAGNDLYLEHSVSPGENFYSVGRLFNVAPKDLASYNNLTLNKGLFSGQLLKIPLGRNNFTQALNQSSSEALVPLYHTVASGETLFRIGANYRNVPLENLKEWNQMNSDQVNRGVPMIVGFLKVNKNESAFAKNEFRGQVRNQNPPVKKETVVVEPKKEIEPVKETKRESVTETQPVNVVQTSNTNNPASNAGKEGFFKQQYSEAANQGGLKSTNAITSVFKSTSGWDDGKYYCFSNDARPGSIMKITVSSSNSTVYAKVLDAIPEIKQNDGVTLVLSNAAADALGVKDEKFEAIINYIK
ncbi:MAG: LysM peptidoglycan-binding domain-containing protein [Chitinophagaceae bacterium]|nr:LysM peptidoglycan-binding domain-containing protein [Chitinophagaceae bacterium]